MARDEIVAGEPPEERILSPEEFYFKQICRVRIGRPPDYCHFSQLVATNDKYGLVAAGHASGVRVISIATILDKDVQVTDKVNTVIDDVSYIGDIVLTSEPVHIGFSADGLIMSVACHSQQTRGDSSSLVATVYFYDVRAFCRTKVPEPFIQTSLGAGRGTAITDFRWNPEESDVFAACLSNGSLVVAKCCFPGQIDLKELAPQSASSASGPQGTGDSITCICWSPKGKQLVAGRADGLLVQFSKTLEVKARVPAPPDKSKRSALSVLWQSTYVFFASYGEFGPAADDVQPTIVGVCLAKDGQVLAYLNYGDVCFGSSDTGQQCGYYMVQIPKWDIILALSSTSVNSCVLGKNSAEQPWPWQPWTLDDSGQIAMPLQQSDDMDSFPRGLALTLAAQNEVPGQGPGLSHPASPVVFILSTEGLLMPYHIINSLPSSSCITKPPEQLSTAGKEFVYSLPAAGTATGVTVADTVHAGISIPQPAGGGVLSTKPASLPAIFGSNLQGLGSMPHHNSAHTSLAEPPAAVPVTTLKPKSVTPVVSQALQVPPAYSETVSGSLTYSEASAGVPALTKIPSESSLKQPVQSEQRMPTTASMTAPTSSLPARTTELEPKTMTSESLYARAIQDEVADFGKEVAALRFSCRREQNVGDMVGSKEEFDALRKKLTELAEDGTNIKATIQSCGTDVHELKLRVLETFTLLEQCRSLQRCYDHPEYQDLLKSRPLDPLLKSKSQEVERLYHTVQQSLDDLSQGVDDDWAQVVQQQRQRATGGGGRTPGTVGASPGRARMRPSDSGQRALDCNDKIYSATKTAELILHSQELLADELTKRLTALHLGPLCNGGGASFVRSRHGHGDLSPEVCAGDSVSKAGFSGGGKPEAPSDGRPRRLTPAANALLCRYLGARKVTDSVAAVPASLSLSKVIAAEKLKQQLTLLQRSSGSLPASEPSARVSGRAMASHQPSAQTSSIAKEPATASFGIPIGPTTRQTAAPVGIALGRPEESSRAVAGPSFAGAAQDRTPQQRQAAAAGGAPFTAGAPSVVPPVVGKTALPTFASMAQSSAQGGSVDRLAAAAAESVCPTPSPTAPLPRTSAAGAVGGSTNSSATTFKPMAPPTGQLPFGPAGSGNLPSAFSIFGVGGSSSSMGRAAEKPALGVAVEPARSAVPAATEGTLPLLATIVQRADAPGRPPQANQLSAAAAAGSAPSPFGTSTVVLSAGVGAKLSAGSSGTASLSKSVAPTSGSSTSGPGVAPAISQNRPAAVDASQPLPMSTTAAAPSLLGSSVPSPMGTLAFGGSSSFGASLFGPAAERAKGFGGLADVKSGSSHGFGGTPAAAAVLGSPALLAAVPQKAGGVQEGSLKSVEATAAPAASTAALSAGIAPSQTSSLLPSSSRANQEAAAQQPLQSSSGRFAFAPAASSPEARAAPLSATTFGAVPTQLAPTQSQPLAGPPILAGPTQLPTAAAPLPMPPTAASTVGKTGASQPSSGAPTPPTSVSTDASASVATTPTAAATADAATAAAAPLPPPPPLPAAAMPTPAAASVSASSPAPAVSPASLAAAAGSGNVLPAAPSVAPATSAPSMSSWSGGAAATSVFGSAPLLGASAPSGGLFGKLASLTTATAATGAAAVKDGAAASTASGDTEMSTEQDDSSAAGGSGLGFGVGGSSNVLGLGGKADPEKAKLNPFGMVSAASSSGASEAAKLFGSPVRPSVFGAAPAFGSPAVINAGSAAAVFGSSPVMGPASSGGLAHSPFASSGSAAPAVFGGGGGGFGATPSHTQFGAPPSFGAGTSVFGGGAGAFGGTSAFGGAPVFGALAGPRSFGGSSPVASVFGGQAQIGVGSAPSATFGSFAAANIASQPTFGMLAQQQTPAGPQPTFGMLAQQQTPAVQPGSVFGGSATFGSGSPGAAPKIQSPSFTSYRK